MSKATELRELASLTTITSGQIEFATDIKISGDLITTGNTINITAETLNISDKNITLASGAANSSVADGAGITIDGAGATLTYSHAEALFETNRAFKVVGQGSGALLRIQELTTENLAESARLELLEHGAGGRFGGYFRYNGNANYNYLGGIQSGADTDVISFSRDGGTIGLHAAGVQRVNVTASRTYVSNSLGLGVDSPEQRLHVSGKGIIRDGGYPYLELGISTTNYFRMVHDNPNDTIVFQKYGLSGNILTISGGVGIGVTVGDATNNKNFRVYGESTAIQYNSEEIRHDVAPALSLDFAKTKELDPRITFHRNSIGTYVDSKGIVRYATHNEPRFDHDPVTGESKGLLIEEQRYNYFMYTGGWEHWNGYWSGYGLGTASNIVPVIEANYAKSPDGTMNATRVKFDIGGGTTAGDRIFWRRCNTGASSATGSMSVWMKSATGTNQTVAFQYNGGRFGQYTVTNEWQRFETTQYNVNGGGCFGLELSGDMGASSCDILVWGFQQEDGAYTTSFIPNRPTFVTRDSKATYYDKDGKLRSAPINQPRYGYRWDGEKMVETGLILEPAAVNKVYNSVALTDQFKGTAFGLAPDGGDAYSTTAMRIEFADVVNQTNTTSVYLKKNAHRYAQISWSGVGPNNGSIGGVTNTASWVVWDFDTESFSYVGSLIAQDGGWRVEKIGTTGWYRFAFTHTNGPTYQSGSLVVGASAVAVPTSSTYNWSSNVIYVWGGQHEDGQVATSYIYTQDGSPAGTQVARAADVATVIADVRKPDVAYIDDLQSSDWYNTETNDGTLYFEGRTLFNSGATDECAFVSLHAGTADEEIRFYHRQSTSTINLINKGGADVILNSTTHGGNVYHKGVGGFADNNWALCVDGGTIYTDTSNVTYAKKATTLGIGDTYTEAAKLSGHIKKIAYYSERLSNAEIQALSEID